jgi:cysteine-rich repeat protein
MACASYTYDAEAIDSDSGHTVSYSDPNSTLPPLNLSLNAATGLIFGQPLSTGSYNVTIQAQDQYQSYTMAPYQATSQQTYTLAVTDEVFAFNPISDHTVYVHPNEATTYGTFYHGPILYYSGVLSVTTSNHVIYGFSAISPALLPSFFLGIDSATGEMQGTATDNTNDPNNYTITVQATNDCGAMATANFTLTILPNEWCGDSITQITEGEECDDSNADGTDSCDTSGDNPKTNGFCSWTFCGDQAVQFPNHYGVNEQCDDGADGDDTNLCHDNCTLTYCGDGVIQVPNGQGTGGPANDGNEECDDGNSTNGDGCNASCIIEFCGDDIVQSGLGEECDDGVSNGLVCEAPYGGNCIYCSDICQEVEITGPYCGDGIKNGGEECDQLDLGGQTCAGLGYDGGTLACLSDCAYDVANCCPTNIATIQTCADNAHTTYFNGVFVSSAANWSSVQEYNVTVQPGKNVIAFAATDWGAWYGVSLTLNRASCNNMTTNNLAGWKCTASPGAGWTAISYDDSSWLGAVLGHPGTAGIRAGNYLAGIKQIWASGIGCCTTVYCRYSFWY